MNKEITRITNIINKVQGITDYQIHYAFKTSCELYYVLNKLETAREVEVDDTSVTIYKDFEEYKGSSSFSVSSSFSDKEIEEKIIAAYNRCEYVKNKFYELPKNETFECTNYDTNITKENLKNQALEVAKAIFKADVYKEGWINSTEIFLTVTENEFVNSKNVEIKYPTYKLMIEVIPTWRGEKEEVELYLSKESNTIDLEDITKTVNEKLLDAKNRGLAANVDDIKECQVILGLEETSSICKFFANQISYGMQYRNMASYKLNDEIQKGDNCDKLTIKGVPFIKGSATSSPIDGLGTKLCEKEIIKDGKAISLFGNAMYGYYMGIEKPTGNFVNFVVEGGSLSDEEMRKNQYLECINFSSFQLDLYSGFFGGEVRLGMYFDGKEKKPVSGFSVSGNIYELINQMHFSTEKGTCKGYLGPKYATCKMNVNK